MKYRVSAKKIKSEYNKIGVIDIGEWVEKVDGKIIDESDFFDDFAWVGNKLICKPFCEPIEESTSKNKLNSLYGKTVTNTTKINSDKLIEKITEFCKHSIKVIDDIADTVATDSDIGRAYAYHKILDIIESEEKKHD